MTTTRVDIVVTGGGTAGHVLPAIAVARALVAAGHDPRAIHFVGTRRGLERRLVPAAGFSLTLLPGRGVVRRPSPGNVVAVVGIAAAFVASLVQLAGRRPRVVVAVGGFGAVACSLAAVVLRVPVVVVNVDSVPGAANRLVGRFAVACAVAFPGTALPRAILTGAPVRPEVLAVDRSAAGRARSRRALSLGEGRPLVGVVGGSLGARRLNDAAIELATRLGDTEGVVVYHVCGSRALAAVKAAASAAGLFDRAGPEYRVVAFEDRLADLFAAADVVVCRAGASTVAELAVIGTPSILVPLPGAPSDHQRRNAEWLLAAGAAVLLGDEDATGARLCSEVAALLAEPGRLEAMGAAARASGRPDAAASVAALVGDVAVRRWRRGREILPTVGPGGGEDG
ncbi:MAG: UDP-N-acetylglucosamine--N-acetylmuramyl-(pentapeptide) pyrophosphoryl-undecaprenol N-acetylglucosamine transferase [Acidimicrobiales bacterium]